MSLTLELMRVSLRVAATAVFLNIALAVIYQRYTEDREDDIVEQNAKRHVSLALAYKTIDADNSKTIDKVRALLPHPCISRASASITVSIRYSSKASGQTDAIPTDGIHELHDDLPQAQDKRYFSS